ncbi:MAG TPA: hypothetical protein V6D28_31175 [Leptolyngbyaceae cyanobacterium]
MSDMQAVYKAIALEVQQQLTEKYIINKASIVFRTLKKTSEKNQRNL